MSGLTRADSLALLLAGRCSVLTSACFLHNIEPGQFLDSPEFESSSGSGKGTDQVFQVSIGSWIEMNRADQRCRYDTYIDYTRAD